MTVTLAIVGAGPSATSLLERVTANVDDLLPGVDIEVHLVDPHPPGGGRVWRSDQSALLRMNSMAEDVTMFPDETVTCDGPVRPGPSLDEWVELVRDGRLGDDRLTDEARITGGRTFPTRHLQSAYLSWVFDTVVADTPPRVGVHVHATTATSLREGPDGRQVLDLADGDTLEVDAVVLALGHLDIEPDDEQRTLAAFAAEHGLTYLPPAYTADVDLDGLAPGATVLLRGTGLTFVDVIVLLTEGRGGRFVSEDDTGRLRYLPSGHEPILVTGSRRGLPYRAKLGYPRPGPPLPFPRFLTPEAVDAVLAANRPADFRRDLWPLVLKELVWAHHHELFRSHTERTTVPWATFEAELAGRDWGDPALDELLVAAVPDPADRFDLLDLDAPLAGLRVGSVDELQDVVRGRVEADLARRADPRFSADTAVFDGMLASFFQIVRAVASGGLDPRSQLEDVDGWWFGLFSTFASGPPPFRLQELLALSRAGIVRFLGAGTWVRPDGARGRFVAGSDSVPDTVEATALIEARLPKPAVGRARDTLVRDLLLRGEISEHVLVGADGTRHRTGRVAVTGDGLQLVDRHGIAHPRRTAIGYPTSRPAAGTFARPRTNALSFRQNDAVARSLLRTLASVAPAEVAAATP